MTLQHATIYEGTDLSVLSASLQTPSSDVRHIIVESFTMADARELKVLAYQRPQQAAYVDLVVVTTAFLREAQHALLKLLEEPPTTTRIHLVVPTVDSLLPTVLSRVQVVKRPQTLQTTEESDLFRQFLAASHKERMTLIDLHHKNKHSHYFIQLFAGAEKYVAKTIKTTPELAHFVMESQRLLQSPGASKKMLSEELALVLPYQA